MNKLSHRDIKRSLVNISQYGIIFKGDDFYESHEQLTNKLTSLLSEERGYAVLYGVKEVLVESGLTVNDPNIAHKVRKFFKEIFEKATSNIDFDKFSANIRQYGPTCNTLVDGFNMNYDFTVSEDVASRDMFTTKCIHFDGNSPFIANIYGPFENIQDGLPIISDVNSFCCDYSVDVKSIIENIPESYGVAISERYYEEILQDYSFAIKADLNDDILMVAIYNQIQGGIAHAAITPSKFDDALPAKRPIYHLEYDLKNLEDYERWYEYYGLKFHTAKSVESDFSGYGLDYHGNLKKPFSNFVIID
jgi:hypothetical protein